MLDRIQNDVTEVIEELLDVAKLGSGDILVVGCSSSEVAGQKIGTYSSEEIGKVIFDTLNNTLSEKGIYLACQCCEHLNRALIIEKNLAKALRLPIVNVVPKLKAGGSFATAAYAGFKDAVAVEAIQANAGIDIGDTLIGMHLMPVVVPVRTKKKTIGEAHVVCARTRAKFIGGSRACYDENMLQKGCINLKYGTYLLVAHNGIARAVNSYFNSMSNKEYASFGIKNCEIVRYDFRED